MMIALAVSLAFAVVVNPGAGQGPAPSDQALTERTPQTAPTIRPAPPLHVATFADKSASAAVKKLADWVIASGDNQSLPFIIVDKVDAEVFAFDGQGRLTGAARALIGLARGDDSAPGVGDKRLSDIAPKERTTPAGRFVASLGQDLGDKDVLWVDYKNAISLHRVITTNPKEHRLQRLATATSADKRISYGCINVPVAFYETVVRPAFIGTNGIVYVLPETRSLQTTFRGYREMSPE